MMKRQWMWAGLLLLVGLALVALGQAWADNNASGAGAAVGGPVIEWDAFDSGGGQSSAGNVTIEASLGQPAAGTASSGQTELCAGFWCELRQAFAELFLPLMVRD